MKRALKTVGRFAFAGWAIFTGTVVACFFIVACFGGRPDVLSNLTYAALFGFFGGLLGAAGGAVLAVVALVLERLIKRPATLSVAADEPAPDPAVWPPAPKPPQ